MTWIITQERRFTAFQIGQAASVLKDEVERMRPFAARGTWYEAIFRAERYLYDDKPRQACTCKTRRSAGLVCFHRPLLALLLILTACDSEPLPFDARPARARPLTQQIEAQAAEFFAEVR